MKSVNHTKEEMMVMEKENLIQTSTIIHLESADVDVVVAEAEAVALSEVITEVVAAEADLLET